MKLVAMGAEAKIYVQGDKILKDRIRKDYRIKEIDERIRKERTRKESRLLQKAIRAGVKAPRVKETEKYRITMENIKGELVKDFLDKNPDKHVSVCKKIGEAVASLHDYSIIHGDLTTSNLILHENQVYVIDFGLGNHSQKVEDKAVDVHLFKQALKSKHSQIHEKCYKSFLKTYSKTKDFEKVMKRLEKVERRGRYK
ncbi:MAG: Kae1-associated serine/threonine protein kinase [Nanoarchaeota archaeon]|nr:Kae1-associated serine/threonine protein kinase [Nanoarchaeota archaeon]